MCPFQHTATFYFSCRSMSELRPRTKQFAVAVFRFCDTLPEEPSSKVIRRQLMRSASSIGANYRAARHAQSRAEFLAKMSIAEEEADETEYWLEKLFGGLSMATPVSTRSHSTSTSSRTLRALRSQRCDFADLVHPRRRSGYSVTAFPAQNGFCTRPVATDSCRCRLGPVRARRPLCLG